MSELRWSRLERRIWGWRRDPSKSWPSWVQLGPLRYLPPGLPWDEVIGWDVHPLRVRLEVGLRLYLDIAKPAQWSFSVSGPGRRGTRFNLELGGGAR